MDISVLLSLLRAGLWADIETTDIRNQGFMEPVDWDAVYQMAAEQSVTGIVLAGLEHSNVRPPQELLLQWIGEVQMIEQRNREMNDFIASIIVKMRKAGIYGLLVKGPGLSQCYERPLWRSCADIDLFFSAEAYNEAMCYLMNHKDAVQYQNARYTKSFGVRLASWLVELHGTLRSGLSTSVDREIDKVQKCVFYGGDVRAWNNNGTTIFLPGVNSDLFFIFTHFVRHFYQNEFVLRQVCDWCRFLWAFKNQIDINLLKKRLHSTDLMFEWKAFAALAVDYLGIPVETMPLYDPRFKGKGDQILKHILKGEPFSKIRDTWSIFKIFPRNTIKFSPAIFFNVNALKIKERIFKTG